MIFGMSTACFFPNVYTEQSIDLMGKMNIENIEVFFSCLSEYKMPFIKELKKRISDYGMNTYSIHALSLQFEPQLFSKHLRSKQDSLDMYKQVLEAGAELGAGAYVFHGPANVKRARKLVLDFPYIAQCTDIIADIAKDFGIKLAWENVHWCWYAKPDFAKKLLCRTNTDNLYFTLDIKQAAQAGYDPIEYLENTKNRLANIHICDFTYSEELGMSPKLPFDGSMDFIAFKNALDNIKYDQGLMLEVYSNNYTDYTQLSNNFSNIKSFFSS